MISRLRHMVLVPMYMDCTSANNAQHSVFLFADAGVMDVFMEE